MGNAMNCVSDQLVQGLQAQVEELRGKIVETLMQIDHILLQENPQIRADYAVKIGYLENALLKAQIEARRERRKVQIAQARVNTGTAINDAAIEKALDEEFTEWEQKLQDRLQVFIEQVEERAASRPMTSAESRELKKLHRILVKRLHPDLGNADDPDSIRFFLITQAAFKSGDLDALRAIECATQHLEHQPREITDVDELHAEIELLNAQLRITEERLQDIKQSDPYALKEKLENAQWVCERAKQLKEEIAQQEAARDAYRQRFEQLKGSGEHGR